MKNSKQANALATLAFWMNRVDELEANRAQLRSEMGPVTYAEELAKAKAELKNAEKNAR